MRGFPREYRGLGTTLILGAIELGTAVSPPILGWIIDRHGFAAMFYSAAAFGLAVTISYALTAAREPDNDNDSEPEIFVDGEEIQEVPLGGRTPSKPRLHGLAEQAALFADELEVVFDVPNVRCHELFEGDFAPF